MSIFNIFKRKKQNSDYHPRIEPQYGCPISAPSLEDIFSNCSDFSSRRVSIGGKNGAEATVCFIDGLVSGVTIGEDVIRPLTDGTRFDGVRGVREIIDLIKKGGVYSASVNECSKMDELISALTSGFCAIVFDQAKTAITFETRSGEHRSISEPTLEKVVKGSKDSFVEALRINTALVRRKLKNPNLKAVAGIVGRRTHTDVVIMYIEGIASPEIVAELTRRIDKIDIDGLTATGHIEEYISDNPRSPFPQIMNTERPDKFAMALLDGRVGLIVDGLPLAFIVPGNFSQFLKSPEDVSTHFLVSSAITLLRYAALVISLLLPALYVAIAMYHQEMIPASLLLSIIDSKQSVPFSTSVEILGMLAAFELLQEAGLQLPGPIGQTISIIGGLIVGQSAVEAKIVSPIAVIIVATAGITGFTVPNHDLSSALKLARFFFVLSAIAAGIFGIMCAGLLFIYHLCCIQSFGVPYMAPFSGGRRTSFFRNILRFPLWTQKLRETQLDPGDSRRQK